MEDNVISLFCKGHAPGTHLLLVDDIDDLIGQDDGPRNGIHFPEHPQSHAASRTLAAFLAMMDASSDENQWPFSSKMSLVCTAKVNLTFLDRFDHVHRIDPPNDLERKNALVDFLGLPSTLLENENRNNDDDTELTLMNLVSATDGLSYAEISQRCSSTIMNMDSNDNQHQDIITTASQRLLAMKDSLHPLTPAALLSHIVDGYVDLRVSSGRELIDMSKGNPEVCPLLGQQSESAWKELEWNIVIPISRAAELSFLTHGQGQPQGHTSLCGGVLLTGIPGSGKSTLSRHCAMFAASFLPSVKLIEVSCSSMIHKEVGSSERAIHRLFDFARSAMPCVVILDDIAIISSVRGKDNTREGTMDRVLSTLLHEMDGVAKVSSAGMAIIGVTNDAAKVDPALRRPGRLGRTVTIGMPDKDARRQIALREVENNFEEELLSASDKSSISAAILDLIADRTNAWSGASVVGLVRDAKRALAKAMLQSENNWAEKSSLTEEFLRGYIAKHQ
jgi:SpoVK/Ycf46/Vps4 family AAA+-type ATPase